MISKRTLPFVIILFVLAVVVIFYARNDPRHKEMVNDAFYVAVKESVGRRASVDKLEAALNNGADPNHVFSLGNMGHFTNPRLKSLPAMGILMPYSCS